MASNSFGTLFRFTTFGESHGPAIGVVVDGCPPLLPLTEADIQPYLDRRRPVQAVAHHLLTQRAHLPGQYYTLRLILETVAIISPVVAIGHPRAGVAEENILGILAVALAIVEFMDGETHRVHYVRRPFQREPDFGVTSVNYDFGELLERAEQPV